MRKFILIGCGIAIIAYFGISNSYAEKERNFRAAEATAAQSVSVLPEGIEEAWVHYINKRLAEEIQRVGNNLKVRTTYIGAEPSYAYVSLNHPYDIDCNTFDIGISVHFGESEDSPSANITGMFSPDYKNEPARGVDPGSIAYKNLDEKLCKLVAEWVAAITSEKPIQP